MTKTKKKKSAARKVTAADLQARLKVRYQAPEWVVLEEVRNQVGYRKQERYADALALSTYPSRGMKLIGFEIKVSRSDVVKELRSPEKARAIQAYCDHWYLVVGSSSLVTLDELPVNWGLLTPHGEHGLRAKKAAPQLEDPKEWDREFMASLLRNAHRNKPLQQELDEAFKNGQKSGRDLAGYEAKRARTDLEALREKVRRFEEVSGVTALLDRTSWLGNLDRQATTFKALMQADLETYFQSTAQLVRQLEFISGQVTEKLVERGVIPAKPRLDEPCPASGRYNQHEIYVSQDEQKQFCRACGGEGA